MHKLPHIIPTVALTALSYLASSTAQAELLDFNDANNLGVTLGGEMKWSDTGGGHLWSDNFNFDDYIYFSAATYVNSFEMNAKPWLDFTNSNESIGFIDIAALNTRGDTVWEGTFDLTNYTSWDNWLTVNVETADITQLTVFGPGVLPHINGFWPSIDNMVINETVVPVPGAVWLFGSGLLALFGGMRSPRLRR